MDRIKFRQFMCLTFLVALAMKMFMLPVLMMRVSGRDSFIVMIIAMSADLILLAFVAAVVHLAGDNTFFDVLSRAFGTITAKIIAAVVGVFYLFKLFMIIADIMIFFSTSVFDSEMSFLHLLPLFLLFGYFAFKPLSATGRLGELFTPIVIVSMLLLGGLTLPEVEFSGLMPLLGEGWGTVGQSLMAFTLWFGDFTVLLIMTGKTDKGGKKMYFSLIAGLVASAILLTFAAVLFSAYGDMPEVLTYGHNISNMTQYAVGSYKFGRFDLVIFCMWLMAVMISAGLMTIFFVRCMDFVCGEKVGKFVSISAGVAMLVLFIIFNELNRVTEFMTQIFWLPSAVIQYLLPPLCLIAIGIGNARLKHKRRKYEKIKQKA